MALMHIAFFPSCSLPSRGASHNAEQFRYACNEAERKFNLFPFHMSTAWLHCTAFRHPKLRKRADNFFGFGLFHILCDASLLFRFVAHIVRLHAKHTHTLTLTLARTRWLETVGIKLHLRKILPFTSFILIWWRTFVTPFFFRLPPPNFPACDYT